ncbi:hypothetical protein K461DRAFT_139114 [Myriangium duriaei CBS 260.36]|uniref:Uncharacterized protein n=1 Tax=Myriangium duriaei CBS 260.36 TaxID=1168546 RepID=A0A9P4J0Q0_9PEZI|nr:hypothetical protein K461DRAFT_139114 [Myriangium duriaei CBS 260.36]
MYVTADLLVLAYKRYDGTFPHSPALPAGFCTPVPVPPVLGDGQAGNRWTHRLAIRTRPPLGARTLAQSGRAQLRGGEEISVAVAGSTGPLWFVVCPALSARHSRVGFLPCSFLARLGPLPVPVLLNQPVGRLPSHHASNNKTLSPRSHNRPPIIAHRALFRLLPKGSEHIAPESSVRHARVTSRRLLTLRP